MAPNYDIDYDSFNRETQFKYPFEQISARNEPVQYAICPACLNPIQLIGLVKRSKCKPYGKHAGKTVNDLPAWNQYRYEYCPFATNKRAITDDASDLIIDDSVIELYRRCSATYTPSAEL